MRQKDIAKVLDSTEAAISQYLSGKRAADFKISSSMDKTLDIVSAAVAEGKHPKVLKYGICQICKDIRTKGLACESCKTESGDKTDCDLCLK